MPARHQWRGAELMARLEAGIVRALEQAALLVQREIKLQLSMSRSPSAPGTPPGAVTGSLRRSIQIDRTKVNQGRIRIGTGIVYGRVHELGHPGITPKKGRFLVFKGRDGRLVFAKKVVMPKRPYMRPGLAAARPRVLALFTIGKLLRA